MSSRKRWRDMEGFCAGNSLTWTQACRPSIVAEVSLPAEIQIVQSTAKTDESEHLRPGVERLPVLTCIAYTTV